MNFLTQTHRVPGKIAESRKRRLSPTREAVTRYIHNDDDLFPAFFGRLDVGSRAGLTRSRPPLPWTYVFQIFVSFCTMCGLENLRLVDEN